MEPEKLETEIRKAFGCSTPVNSMSQDDFEALNYDLNRYDNATVRKLLPLLLIREMHELSSGGESWSGDGIIYFLDGLLRGRIPSGTDPKKWGEYERLRTSKENRFSDFTRGEARAILNWLETVARETYRDCSCLVDVESAIEFWRVKLTEA